MSKRIIVLVHGWSVHNTDTYGGLAERLEMEAGKDLSADMDIRQIWLGKYISFKDEVRLDDISKAFDKALNRELGEQIRSGSKCIVITHSTGGPVLRNWIDKFYTQKNSIVSCPVSHLIMLAPANFGSALAQLGKSRVSRLKSWFEGIEPGQGVLNWLELGSSESWRLNKEWVYTSDAFLESGAVFPFVLTGQTIDRSVYDHVNPYTGEMGSDGVVRAAAANLNCTYIRLEQQDVMNDSLARFVIKENKTSARSAFTLIPGKAHSGDKLGIMRSVKADDNLDPTVAGIMKCIKVGSHEDYRRVCEEFDAQTTLVQQQEMVEADINILLPDKFFINDPKSMLIVKIADEDGKEIGDCDIIFTGPKDDPDLLPHGFLADRQRNTLSRNTVTFFFNYTAMTGGPAINYEGRILRGPKEGVGQLGLIIDPHNNSGFAHYVKGIISATEDKIETILKPYQTTLLEIVMKRVVREGTFRLTKDRVEEEFRNTDRGKIV